MKSSRTLPFMYVNTLNAYLPDWLNVIFFSLFRHLPVKTGRVLGKCPVWQAFFPRLATPRANKLAPEPGNFFINGIA
jgi:hypothetical protein